MFSLHITLNEFLFWRCLIPGEEKIISSMSENIKKAEKKMFAKPIHADDFSSLLPFRVVKCDWSKVMMDKEEIEMHIQCNSILNGFSGFFMSQRHYYRAHCQCINWILNAHRPSVNGNKNS